MESTYPAGARNAQTVSEVKDRRIKNFVSNWRNFTDMPNLSTPQRRLVFLTVNSSFSHSTLALPLLHSACRDIKHWEWLRYDMTIKEDVMRAVRAIYTYRCDLLVTDLYLFNRQTALELLTRYHALSPACKIAVGGPECLGEGAEDLLREYPWLDRVFRGEGELLFRDYLEHFDDKKDSSDAIVPSGSNGVFREWSSSAYPVRDPFFATDKPFVQMESSRGCPLGCFYCTSGGTLPRYRSLEQVREELTLLASKGVKEVRLLDRTFNLPQERGTALLRIFREEFPQMHFHLELHPQFLNAPLQEELCRALPGQLHIEAGIQCLDQRVQDFSGRRSNVTDTLRGLKFLCSQTAFETHADLLAGLPQQTWDHILADTITLMNAGTAEIQLEVLKVLPGTPLRKIAEKHGIKYNPSAPYDVMMSDFMSMKEIQYARDLSRLLDMTYNNKYLHSVLLIMKEECPSPVLCLLDCFHEADGDSETLWDLKKRFLFLLDFCRKYSLKHTQLELAYQWLRAGFTPGQGADLFSKKCNGIPSEAVLRYGSIDCLNARETRYYALKQQDKISLFAYNRSYSLNLPAGIWEIKNTENMEIRAAH